MAPGLAAPDTIVLAATTGQNSYFSNLEQVDVTSFSGRGMRFSSLAALGMALAIPVWAAAHPQATQTTLRMQTLDRDGNTQATLSINVAGEDGLPATGAVVIEDGSRQLSGAALSSQGEAQIVLGLLPGDHSLRAVYKGDATHEGSQSDLKGVRAQSGVTPDFGISVNPAAISLTAGQSGAITASVTPVNASALSAPMFVTLSCSGNPDQSSCSFTPENLEILPNATGAITSSLVITTQGQPTHYGGTSAAHPPARPGSHRVELSGLFPGALGMLGIAFAARRRRWLSRLSLLGLLALITSLGTTACNPLWNYQNHGPPYNLPTPAGTYTLQIIAQSSNGVTAATHHTNLVLTVQ